MTIPVTDLTQHNLSAPTLCTGEALDALKALLPEIVLDIADLIGMAATKKLVMTLGGLDFAIPKGADNSKPEQLLVGTIGREATDKLMSVYGGDRIYIPRCDAALRKLRNSQFVDAVSYAMSAEDMSQKQAIQYVAPKFGITERLAYKILADTHTENIPQLGLF